MTSETHITHETARLLKRAGFDWHCERRYVEGRPVRSYPPKDHNKQSGQGLRPAPDVCSMPTQALTARWLREAKGILIVVDMTLNTHGYEKYIYKATLLTDFNEGDKAATQIAALKPAHLYVNYETALEHGLREVLIILNNLTNE